MRKINVAGLEITTTNTDQVINMGGPYIGVAYSKGKVVAEDCVLENFIYRDDLRKLFFVKYHFVNNNWFFTINFFSIDENEEFEFTRIMKMVFIKEFLTLNELEIYHALHDKHPETRDIFDVSKEEFKKIR